MTKDPRDKVPPIHLPDEAEWLAWAKHVRKCAKECRTLGRDCPEAVVLRAALQRARDAAAVTDAEMPSPFASSPPVATSQGGGEPAEEERQHDSGRRH